MSKYKNQQAIKELRKKFGELYSANGGGNNGAHLPQSSIVTEEVEQFLDEQLTKKEEEVIEKINTEVTEMHKNMYEEMEKANHQDQYLNGVVRGITVVGRYLNVLKTQTKNE